MRSYYFHLDPKIPSLSNLLILPQEKKIEGKKKVIRSELRNYEKVPKKAEKKKESTQSHTNDCCKF